jgi:exopolyphosphatase/guanosine-5'-triphosphate,3'-diphosphate pyrophosphatase
MIISIIDCGTNTFHLLIAEADAHSFKILFKKNSAVKLGEGGFEKRIIAEAAFNRGVTVLKEFEKIIARYQPEKKLAYATAAIRKASNGRAFVDAAYTKTGIRIETIDGNKEAELIYFGVHQAVPLSTEKVLIMDIGGGSVEFIIANHQTLFWKQSFELGAALLLDKFKPADPLSLQDLSAIEAYLHQQLKPLLDELIHHPFIHTLIGSSGSFETFAEMISEKNNQPSSDYRFTTSFPIQLNEYLSIHQWLVHSSTAQRKGMKSIIDMRVDMIVIASILLNYVIHNSGIEKLTLSTYALKEGMLYFALNEPQEK